MAHNLNLDDNTGTYSFVSSKNLKAWHGLGQILPQEFLTSEECIKYANLNYEVGLTPVFANTPNNVEIKDKFATYRKDNGNVLGIVGNRYTVVQNKDAFSFFDAIVGEGAAIFETAGALGAGEHVFITAKMPEEIRIAGTDDITEVYVVLKMSHDGTGAIKAMITPVRVVCQNTLNAAIKSAKNCISIRHTQSVNEKLEEAHKLLGISHKYVEQVNEMFNRLHNVKISDKVFNDLLKNIFPSSKEEDSTRVKNIREQVTESYFSGVGQAQHIGTGWGAYNGITHYLGHVKSYGNDDIKFESLMEGNSARTAQKALDFINAMN